MTPQLEVSSEKVLDQLIGQQLSAITFVQDYVQVSFDAFRVTLNVWPIVNHEYGQVRFGQQGYRDALCSFIGHQLSRVAEGEAAIELFLGAGSIAIDLLAESGVERVIFEDTATGLWAWW
jgi:hypothetical protein